ncbi:MAG: hypothetical protein GQ474_09590 [Sulfurimonas sp.]|nr:hypothetical protein [Sulfurimonas sp.]
MGKLNTFSFGLLGKKAKDPILEGEVTKDTMAELTKELIQGSMPRNLMFSATTQKSFTSVSRDAEYLQRHEIYQDAFTREMVKVIITRAIGATHNSTLPLQLSISKKAKLNDKLAELIKKDLNDLARIIDKDLLEVVIDSQFYGDGFVAIKIGEDKGIEKLLYNFSTKAFNVTPYRTNHDEDVAYEVSSNTRLIGTGKNSQNGNGRFYVSPHRVARLNSQSNGIMELQANNIISVEKMNAFSDKETIYEDFIYGGVIEGVGDSFANYKWAINSLANIRISSSMVERFITLTLESANESERKLLKNALEHKIKAVRDTVRDRMATKDPTPLVANHIIPTTSDNTNSVQIQESTPQFNQQIDDILFHLKRYVADIGFNLQMTPFGDSQMGGGEKDGIIQNSLQMDTQGEQIRRSIAEYVEHIVKVHFLSKYNLEIDIGYLEIDFTSTINKAKKDAEDQRMEAISNTQQMVSVIEQLKSMMLEDNEANRVFLREMAKDMIPNTASDKETMLDSMIEIVFTKPPKEEE